MRIAYAIPVRHIEALQDGTLGGFGIESWLFQVASLPCAVVVPLIVTLAASHVEAQGPVMNHRLQAQIIGPDLAGIGQPLDTSFGVGPGPNQPEGWEVRSTFPLSLRFEASIPGMHSIEISTDGGLPTSVAVMILEMHTEQVV